ncbi:MAG: tyrosine-type recombinase/integrase [Prevotellaceae bacterium]|jgi:integrase|nr:tyrosine-type recombinase/integrase [Prevotellaceae bacterium]
MRRKKILINPKLCDRNGDLSKKWYVEISQRNPQNEQMVRRRFEVFENCNINSLSSASERYRLAQKLVSNLNERLNSGWTIFNDVSDCVYEDQLQYAATAAFYKNKIESNSNYSYWVSRFIKEELEDKDVAIDTMRTYKSRYRVFGNWLHSRGMSRYDLSAINSDTVKQFFNYMKNERKVCALTHNSYKQMLDIFFTFTLKKGGIDVNPVSDIPVNRRQVDCGAERIEKGDLEKLMKEIDRIDPQVGLACRFEYYCGMRPGYEVRLLKISDLNLRRGISRVTVSQENAKTNKIRKIVIPDVFCDYLINEWHLDVHNGNLYVFGQHGKPGDTPIGRNTLRGRFNKIRDRLGLPLYYKFYSMKHTGAITLAEKGVSLIKIRDHLGHSNLSSTEHYLKNLGYSDCPDIRDFPEI